MYLVEYGKFKDSSIGQAFIGWFQKEENMSKYKAALLKGMKLLEIYLPIAHTADHDIELWFEIDSWSVLDKDQKEIGSIVAELIKELGTANLFEWIRMKVLRSLSES